MMRTHGAGTLRAAQAGTTVTLAGWVARRRDHGGVAFLDLRDASGVVQVLVRDEMLAASGAHELRNEYCILITGEVQLRPEGNANPELPTGEVEVVASRLEVLSPSAPLPFQIDDAQLVLAVERLPVVRDELAVGRHRRIQGKLACGGAAAGSGHCLAGQAPDLTR